MAVVGKKVFQFYPCSSAHPEPSAMAGFMLPVHTFVNGQCCVVPNFLYGSNSFFQPEMMGGVCHGLIFPRVPGSLVGKCGAGTWAAKTNTGSRRWR